MTQQVDGGAVTSTLSDSRTWSLGQHWWTPLGTQKISSTEPEPKPRDQLQTDAWNFAIFQFFFKKLLQAVPRPRGAWLQQGINERLVWFACWSKFSQSGQFSLSLKSVAIGLLQTQHTNCWFWSMHVQNSDTIWPKHQSYAPKRFKNPLLNFCARRPSNNIEVVLRIESFRKKILCTIDGQVNVVWSFKPDA